MSTIKTTPRDVFLHALMIVSLAILMVSITSILFSFIEFWIPDAIDSWRSTSGIHGEIRGFMSAIIISLPVFLGISKLIEGDLSKNPAKHKLGIRKWLLYITLFVASIILIIDGIVLVQAFLAGELTLRFFLKILTVLVAAGGVFSFYLWALKRTGKDGSPYPKQAAIALIVVVVAVIVSGFMIIGPPSEQRNIRLDEERVQDLSSIQYAVVDYYSENKELPASLDILEDQGRVYEGIKDPETGAVYTYTITGDMTFELCATFSTESDEDSSIRSEYGVKGGSSWKYTTGENCFERTIDPEELQIPDRAILNF